MNLKIIAKKYCDYCHYIKQYSKHTTDRTKLVVGVYAREMGVVEIEDVTKKNVMEFYFWGRTERNWSSASFLSYYNSLSVFFKWCIKEGHIEHDYTQDIEKPRLTKKIPVRLTRQESLRLLEVVYNYPYQSEFLRYRNHAIFATFLFTGVRRMELLNLKYTDIDIENLTLFVRQGKGGKDRIIPISYQLAEILSRYLKERKRLKRTCPEFFASVIYNKGLSKDGLEHVVDRLKKAAGLKFGLHQLRHTFATLMLEGGCDIFSLSKMMGHSSIKTTTIYLAASAEHLRSQIFKHPLNDVNLK